MNKKADDDEALFEMQLKTLFPSASTWPSEYVHQRALHGAFNEATALSRAAERDFRKLDDDSDLTPEAKKRHRAELANQYNAKLERSATYARASEAVEYVLQKYDHQINGKMQKATDPQTVGVHTQVRAQLHDIKDPKERLNFLAKHGDDITLISAVLSAPAYVSNLSGHEVALLRSSLEKHADPEVIKERDFVKAAWAEIERGFGAAKSRISKRGGLQQSGLAQPQKPTPKAEPQKPTPNFARQPISKEPRKETPAWSEQS
jgi:hypothetical protein